MNELSYETTGSAGGAIMLDGDDVLHVTFVGDETDARLLTPEEMDALLLLIATVIEHRGLLAEGLDSHTYWQLSSEWNRNDGYVIDGDQEEPETAAEIKLCEQVQDALGAWDSIQAQKEAARS